MIFCTILITLKKFGETVWSPAWIGWWSWWRDKLEKLNLTNSYDKWKETTSPLIPNHQVILPDYCNCIIRDHPMSKLFLLYLVVVGWFQVTRVTGVKGQFNELEENRSGLFFFDQKIFHSNLPNSHLIQKLKSLAFYVK